MSRTVQDLLDELRSQLDEFNDLQAKDKQLLAALNRGQRKAANITARKYEDLFWAETSFTTEGGQIGYPMPAAAFGRRVEGLSLRIGDVSYKLKRVNNHQKVRFKTSSQITRPYYYALTKNSIELYPRPSAGHTIDVYYNDAPLPLVKPQGRVVGVNHDSSYVLLDSIGENLSTNTDGFSAYINFIDYTTGAIKGSAQISHIDKDSGQVVVKDGSLTRTTVLGRQISEGLPEDLAEDDYVCLVTGTCVPELPDAYTDYLVQYGVVEIRRRFGEPTNEEYAALKELEDELVNMWAGRESSRRIRRASPYWRNWPAIRRL